MAFLFYFNTARMKFLEKDLEQIIFETNKHFLAERGLYLQGKQFRQLRIGHYGIADLVYIQRPFKHPDFKERMNGLITVLELKQDKISVSAFLQALRYAKGISRYLEKRNACLNYDFRIVVCASELDTKSDIVYLPDFFKNPCVERFENDVPITYVEFFTYDMKIDGLHFKEEYGYKLSQENLWSHALIFTSK